MFFDNWHDLLRIVVVGTAAYVGLVCVLRLTGKRTLSKMNAFDLVATIAFGSTLAAVLLNRDVSLAEGLTAFAVLCGLQYGVTWVSVRSTRFRRLVKAEPALLFYGGRFVADALRRERVTREEVYAAIRAAGSQLNISRTIPAGCTRTDIPVSMNSIARAVSARSRAWRISGASSSMCSSRKAR